MLLFSIGMKKQVQTFIFFQITNAKSFKKDLANDIHPRLTTTTQMLNVHQQPAVAVNIAFSQNGLDSLGITENLGDTAFTSGQASDANTLGDPGTKNWVPQFTGTSIHFVIMLSSNSQDNIDNELAQIKSTLDQSATEMYRLDGAARPGDQEGHERTSP